MPVNQDRRIKLVVSTQLVYTSNVTQDYRMTITASNANLMPNEVFRMLRKSGIPGFPTDTDVFMGVCSPSELKSLPVDMPDPTAPTNFFRTASLDLSFNTPEIAMQAFSDIIEAVKQLKDSLDYADGLGNQTQYWVGNPG